MAWQPFSVGVEEEGNQGSSGEHSQPALLFSNLRSGVRILPMPEQLNRSARQMA